MIPILLAADMQLEEILRRSEPQTPDVRGVVGEILQDVKARGDAAVAEYTARFDGAALSSARVSKEEIQAACGAVGENFLQTLRMAAANIRAFHQNQVRPGFAMADTPGIVLGQKVMPLARVGIYVPGGTAAYPSTVLMDAIPAKIAGVKEIVMVTPPDKEGNIKPEVLAAASVAGVDTIFKMGGAQAVAALALGTEMVPKVDKIVGPGNLYVATAKQMLYGFVDIDMIAGPSEILIVADQTANPAFLAADMLGQAEHDKLASSVLITTDSRIAREVQKELETQLPLLPRAEIAAASLKTNGRIIVVENLEKALQIANTLAPEHLELCTEDPFALLPLVENAGSIFLGSYTPEALGDYFAGPNHTLPTGGTARFSSPLSVDDFVKKSSYIYYSKPALAAAAERVQDFANREGLHAHANSVALRVKEMQK